MATTVTEVQAARRAVEALVRLLIAKGVISADDYREALREVEMEWLGESPPVEG
jgi:mannitol/fructose-specific phosphotransferase system IIA component (Ntr-type)